MSDQPAQQRTIAILLLTGAVLLMAGNLAHPVDADLTATSRFELATGSSWVAIHLALAGGFAAITAALVALARAARAHTVLAARCCCSGWRSSGPLASSWSEASRRAGSAGP